MFLIPYLYPVDRSVCKQRRSNANNVLFMKIKELNVVVVGVLMLVLSGCVKEKLVDPTPEPGQGRITVTPDWTMLASGVERPTTYVVEIGDYTAECTTDSHTPDRLFDLGNYKVYLYNKVDGFTISDGKVHGEVPSRGYDALRASQLGRGTLPPSPLFLGMAQVEVEEGDDQEFLVPMQQQTAEIVFVLEATDHVEGITGTLTGLAGVWDANSDQAIGESITTTLTFEKITEGEDAGKFRAVLLMLGTIGDIQQLQLTVTYNDGTPETTFDPQDIGEQLANINTDKSTPVSLETEIEETPTPGNPAGFTATINDWKVKTSSGIAN